MIKKIITNSGDFYQIGDFCGSGDDEVIQSFDRDGYNVKIWTNLSFYDLTLVAGNVITFEDGTSELIKSKYDVEKD